ncbi:MAG: glycosyltransferase family 39 protein [Gillisia sp.]
MNKLKFSKIFLGITIIIFLAYNMVVALDLRYEADGDAWDYIHLGLSLAKSGKYGHFDSSREQLISDFKNTKIKNTDYNFIGSTAFRPPVWPFLIGGIFLVFGYNLTYVLIFKFLLHLLGIFIFYKTLKLLKFKEVLILIGVFLYGISPAWQLYSRVFLSEPITLFFITLWIYLLIRFTQNKSGFLPQAILGGILVLSHPYFIFLPFSVWLILWLTKKMQLSRLIICSFICASIVSIWIIRNFVVLETNEVVLTTSSGAVMAKGWNPDVIEEHTNTKGDLANEELVLQGYVYNKNKRYNEVQLMQLYKDATLHFIRSNPDLILPILGNKLLSAFNPFPETPRPGILETGRWIFHLLSLLSLIYILFFSKNKLILSLAIGLILSTIGITFLTYSGFRFRMPQIGLELLFLVFVIDDIIKRRAEEKNLNVKLK